MAVIGIITCEILELEFAKLLSEDAEIKRISVLEDKCSARIIELLEERQIHNLQRLPHTHSFHPEPEMSLEVFIYVLEMGLHRTRKILNRAVTKAIQTMQTRVDALLLGYGRCGGSLDGVNAFVDRDIPIFQPMDGDHPIDDCVALSLGGGQRYYAEQRKIAGTYFLTPGWSLHWQQMLDMRTGKVSQPGLERLLSGYERALMVQTPAINNSELQRHGDEFKRVTGLRLEMQKGTMTPLITAWNSTKGAVYSKSEKKQREIHHENR
jgi:hypothetical protein